MRLEGKVALITGAGSGIGKATAELFAREGAKVSATDVNEASAKAVSDGINAGGGEAVHSIGDVSVAGDVQRIVQTTVDAFGRIDVLLNNAGISDRVVPSNYSDEEVWDRVMEVNVKGVYLMAWYLMHEKAAVGADLYIEDLQDNIQLLRDEGHKTIVFTNSTNKRLLPPRAESWEQVMDMVLQEKEAWEKTS